MIKNKGLVVMAPCISIGMPVYNAQCFVKEAIDSILGQTFRDFELVICDNASSDRTEEICRQYAAKDNRVSYYRNQKNLGAAFNYNRTFELSTGKYFKWAAYDDLCGDKYLERCVDVLEHDCSVVLCYPRTIVIDESGCRIRKYFDRFNLDSSIPHKRFRRYHELVKGGHECHPIFGLIRADTLRKSRLIGSFVSSDLILLGELVLHGKFYEVDEWLFFRRIHPQTSMRKYRSYRERISWFEPAKRGHLQMARWRWLYEYLEAIKRAQINKSEKALCDWEIAKWFVRNFPGLAKDVVKATVWPVCKPFLNYQKVGSCA